MDLAVPGYSLVAAAVTSYFGANENSNDLLKISFSVN